MKAVSDFRGYINGLYRTVVGVNARGIACRNKSYIAPSQEICWPTYNRCRVALQMPRTSWDNGPINEFKALRNVSGHN